MDLRLIRRISRPSREMFHRLVGWTLIAAAVAVFVLSLEAREPVKDALLPTGVLIALSGVFFGQAHESREHAQSASSFYLESCIKAFQEAQDLLANGNNDRATWIAAGRALVHAKELSARITVKAHLHVLELNRLRYRRFFGQLLQSKPATFFYGTNCQEESLDDAAKLSSASGGDTVSSMRELSKKSLHAVWEAAQWPAEYDDPLGRTFSAEEVDQLMVLYPGLHEYLEHKEAFHSVGGRLYPRKSSGERR
jgi:hypothetical protein